MEMTRIEKRLVNSDRRSASIASSSIGRLAPHSPLPGQTYLDFGCGTGSAVLSVARVFGLRATGVDVDPDQIARARASTQDPEIRFEVCDEDSTRFGDGEFDYVACHRVTHHVPRWRGAFAEAARLVKPGGLLIYTDFVVPRWFAPVGERLFSSLGFPTLEGIQASVERFNLRPVRFDHTLLNLEAVWSKSDDG